MKEMHNHIDQDFKEFKDKSIIIGNQKLLF